MGVGFAGSRSDLYSVFDYTQNTLISYSKEVFVETLREFFSKDSSGYYHYVKDPWGYPKTPSARGLPFDAGINDSLTSRLFIGTELPENPQLFPALLVRHVSSRSAPISMSRNKSSIQYENQLFQDGYGNARLVRTPAFICTDGGYESSFSIEIKSRSLKALEELSDLISISFIDLYWDDLNAAGISIKPAGVSISQASNIDDRNDKLWSKTITLDVWTEWSRKIPVRNTIDIIKICIEIGNTDVEPFVPAPNLTVEMDLTLIDQILNLNNILNQ